MNNSLPQQCVCVTFKFLLERITRYVTLYFAGVRKQTPCGLLCEGATQCQREVVTDSFVSRRVNAGTVCRLMLSQDEYTPSSCFMVYRKECTAADMEELRRFIAQCACALTGKTNLLCLVAVQSVLSPGPRNCMHSLPPKRGCFRLVQTCLRRCMRKLEV